ncbi:MAG: glycosyltransferase [Sphingomonas sp.]|nr:glycosyltransferase [Sphingomonas sp.]
MKLGILIGAEPYQAHHVADIAWELAERPGVQVEIIATLPASLAEVARLERCNRDASVPTRLLKVPLHLRLLQSLRLFGSLKVAVMRHRPNVALLSGYSAIVTPTDHARFVASLLRPRPFMIYVNHGIGGRAQSYSDKYLAFDFVLVAGRKDEKRLLADGRIRPGHYAVIGYSKFEAAKRLSKDAPRIFENDRPVVLFNPHSKRALRSWERFARPLIDQATRTSEFNLIVAPHAKLFSRRPAVERRRWEHLAVPGRLVIDLGSPSSIDMTYTSAADIYVGDVSSQIYEFLSKPKPCVFLNAHQLEWRGNPDFPNWDLGDVVDTPAEAIEAIRQAVARHPRYEERQSQRISEIVDRSPGAAARAADAILTFLPRTKTGAAGHSGAQKQRIMFLLSDLGSGGTARATMLVANGLAKRGVDVSLVVMRGGGIHTSVVDPQVKLIEVNAGAARGPAMLFGLLELVEILRIERPTQVVSAGNHMHVVTTIAHMMAGVPACKLVLKMTNPVERKHIGRIANAVRRAWYKWAFQRSDAVLLIADSTREEFRRTSRVSASKLHVVDNPYITDAMLAAGKQISEFEPGDLLAIGRLVPQKNYPLLLDALARIAHLAWTLNVLGDGPLLKSLQRQAQALGIGDRVKFQGFVPDPIAFLKRAHVLVLASAWEGQGAVLLEALACGCPVIATHSTAAVGAVLAQGRYGKLVSPGDAEELAQAIAAELKYRSKILGSWQWVERYRIEAGVASHAKVLGIELT